MLRTIRWSKTARQTYLDLLLYLQEAWGSQVATELDEKLQTVLSTIIQMPYIYPASQKAAGKNTN